MADAPPSQRSHFRFSYVGCCIRRDSTRYQLQPLVEPQPSQM